MEYIHKADMRCSLTLCSLTEKDSLASERLGALDSITASRAKPQFVANDSSSMLSAIKAETKHLILDVGTLQYRNQKMDLGTPFCERF